MSEKLPRLKVTDKRHKELRDKYDHYPCEFCMGIGAEEVISEFVTRIEKHRLQMEKQEGYWTKEFFEDIMEYKRELEAKLE